MVEITKRYVRYADLLADGIFTNRMDAARKVASGFPAPIELGPNTICWDREEVAAWLASRPRRRPKTGAKPRPPAIDDEAAALGAAQ
jgi:hypothetical protein